MMTFFKQYRLNEDVHFIDIHPKVCRDSQPVALYMGHNDSHVNVALRLWIALRVGTVQIDLRLCVEAGADYSLIVADESESFVAAENF